jgi:hypothetical protein
VVLILFRRTEEVAISKPHNFMRIFTPAKLSFLLMALAALLLRAPSALGIDFEGVQPAAFALPEVHASVQPETGGLPYHIELFGDFAQINTEPAYLDTGTSGVVISEFVADNWMRNNSPIPRESGVTFHDIAIGGTVAFEVTPPLRMRIASSAASNVDLLSQYETVYNQAYGPMRLQVGPHIEGEILEPPPNVFGMPVMMGKTVVIDPSVNLAQLSFQQTYIYNPGTPFNPGAVDTNPGIPNTSHHVQLSYGDFARFTETIGGEGPQLNHNPMIGPNPLLQLDENPPLDNTPPVGLSFGGQHATATMLFDTGAVASFLSASLAASLHVRYSGQVSQNGDPLLETFDPDTDVGTLIPANLQFALPIAGISGQGSSLAGFYLDSLVLHTLAGSLDDADPDNIRYLGAPVLVLSEDIVLTDPTTQQSVILDGIFGANFFLASASLDLENASESPYRWITFDEPNGILGLHIVGVPEPSSYAMAGCALIGLAGYAWRRRRLRCAAGRGVNP